jgi:polyhydroxybutyrate depolymerase
VKQLKLPLTALISVLAALTVLTVGCTFVKTSFNQNASSSKATVTENATSASAQNNYTAFVLVKGLQRSYIVHLPAAYDKRQVRPLVLVLHGGGSEARTMNPLTDFNVLADKEGFVAVYPEGYEHNWNDGRGDPGIKAQAENIDDVAFISALIDRLVQDLNINKNMVYVTGISNGAMMSNRLGSELSDKIAAIAPVAGNIPQKTISIWSPARPVSALIINGTEDPLVPFNGGDVSFLSLKRGKVVSVAETVKFWVSKDVCPVLPKTEQLPHLSATDPTSTTVETYTGCKDGTEVVLYKVNEGGHTWPGGLQYMSEKVIGTTSRDFNATEVIWQFFKRHPMQ